MDGSVYYLFILSMLKYFHLSQYNMQRQLWDICRLISLKGEHIVVCGAIKT